MQFAAKVNQTTADTLKTELAEGLNVGEGIPQLQERVGRAFGPKAAKKRAERIARTESHRAAENGRLQFWHKTNDELVQAGEQPAFVGKRWRTVADPCPLCAA